MPGALLRCPCRRRLKRNMSNNSLKFLFLFVLIGVVIFSRYAYHNPSGLPVLSASDAQTVAPPAVSDPMGIVVLKAATATADNNQSAGQVPGDATATQANATVGYVIGDSTPAYSKIGNTNPPQLQDAESLVADLSNGAPMVSLNTNARWPLASLTKLMTAVVVYDNMDLNQKVTITPQMFAVDPQEYTLQIGGTYTVSDLLHVLLLPSSNVAAEALADSYGHDQFMALMNEKAAQWGMTTTFYDDPSGLSAANQSSAHDLMLLAQQIYQNYPQLLAVTRVPHVTITNFTNNQKVAVNSIDLFSGEPDFIGGKTGHTDEASGNLLTIFNYENHPLLVIVLGTADRFGDSSKLYAWAKLNFK